MGAVVGGCGIEPDAQGSKGRSPGCSASLAIISHSRLVQVIPPCVQVVLRTPTRRKHGSGIVHTVRSQFQKEEVIDSNSSHGQRHPASRRMRSLQCLRGPSCREASK